MSKLNLDTKLEEPPSDLLDNGRWVVERLQVLAVSDCEPDDNGDERDKEGQDEVTAPALAASSLQ